MAPRDADAQCAHGVSIFKTCQSPKRSCAVDADCPDTPCADGVCTGSAGGGFLDNHTDCTISLSHADTCGDTTKITEGFDIEDFGGDNVRVPAVGNLPISGIFGNAVCCAGPTLPCFVGPAGSVFVIPALETGCGALALPGAASPGTVSFQQNTYTIQPTDPDPLPNQGNVKVKDLCNAGVPGCSTGISTVQFIAATDLVTGCELDPKPLSTPCEADGNLCTTDHCDGNGTCVLLGNVSCPGPVPPCEGGSICNPGTGMCDPQPDAPLSTPCDSDGNLCTNDHCNGTGQCVFLSNVSCPGPVPPCEGGQVCNPMTGMCQNLPDPGNSTPCEFDGNLCTLDHCDGSGMCVAGPPKTCQAPNPPCEGGQICNPLTGNCDNQPDAALSTPCEADNSVCTNDHCDGNGNCVFLSPNPLPSCGGDHFKCYRLFPDTPFQQRTVTLVDQFGPSTATVLKPDRLCNPASKNGEPVNNQLAHLACYKIQEPRGAAHTVLVRNQFGDQMMTAVRADSLCNPADKNNQPRQTEINHFKCYRVRAKGFTKRTVTIVDQFETTTSVTVKPKFLCNPVDKNGEGIVDPSNHLACYIIKTTSPFSPQNVTVTDQFAEQMGEALTAECRKRALLCVPSEKNPGSTTTSTTTVTTTSTTTTTAQSPSGAFLNLTGGLL